MVHKIPFLRDAAEIVYAHQERFDGKGYPRGLRGDEISSWGTHLRSRRHAGRNDIGPSIPQKDQL
jgi:hypothetical protein